MFLFSEQTLLKAVPFTFSVRQLEKEQNIQTETVSLSSLRKMHLDHLNHQICHNFVGSNITFDKKNVGCMEGILFRAEYNNQISPQHKSAKTLLQGRFSKKVYFSSN